MRRMVKLAAATAVVATVLVAGGALATAGSGVLTNQVLVRSAFRDDVDLKVKVQVDGATQVAHVGSGQVVMSHLVLGPGGQTGWHSHPGPAIVTIASGSFTLYDGDDPTCTGRTYVAGEAFVDIGSGHVHRGQNPSTTDNVELYVTYLGVPAGTSPRIDAADPGNC
jgi:quercetin dioxygenase-like cupin family protein